MSVLSDKTLIERAAQGYPIVSPFHDQLQRHVHEVHRSYPALSYGQSSAGIDIRLDSSEFYLVKSKGEINPKRFTSAELVALPLLKDEDGYYFLMPPFSYSLGLSMETFAMPRDVAGVCAGKSTLARCGLIVNCTLIEPGWCGQLVIEFFNANDQPLRLYAMEGVAQCFFHRLDQECLTSYADRGGKYQNQDAVWGAKL